MALINLYLATEQKLVRMRRELSFERVPVAGEYLVIEAGGLLPHKVDEVTHMADGRAELFIYVRRHPDGGWDLYGTHAELQEEIRALEAAGWDLASEAPNRRFRNHIGTPDSRETDGVS